MKDIYIYILYKKQIIRDGEPHMCIVIFWDNISVINICGAVGCLMIFWTNGTGTGTNGTGVQTHRVALISSGNAHGKQREATGSNRKQRESV